MSHLHAIIGPCPPSTGCRGTRPRSSRRSAAAGRSCSCSRRRGRRPAHARTPRCSRAADVIAAIADTTVPVRVDADLRPDIADRYGLGHWPSLLVLTPEGHVLTGGTHLDDALAARIRDAARAFADARRSVAVGAPCRAARRPASTTTRRHRRLRDGDPRHARSARPGRACRTACPRPAPPCSPWRTRPPAAMPTGPRSAADTIDALHDAAPGLDETGVVAFVTDDGRPRPGCPARGSGRVGPDARACRSPRATARVDEPARPARARPSFAPSGATTGTGAHGPGSPRLVLVDASARACRALLAAADALDRPDLAREAIDALEVLAPVAYSRGSGVSHTIADGHARGPVLLDDAMLLAHALLDADAWRADPVYRDLAEELVRTSLARLQDPSGAIRDRVAALAGAGQVGRLADAHHPLTGNAAAARLLLPALPRRRRARGGGAPHPRAR